MAKRVIVIMLILLSLFSLSDTAYAGDAVKKLGRGFCNVATFVFELPLQVSRVNNSDGPMAGVTYGAAKGLAMMLVRAYVGAYEIITFPFPVPKDFKPILTDPEFMFEEQIW